VANLIQNIMDNINQDLDKEIMKAFQEAEDQPESLAITPTIEQENLWSEIMQKVTPEDVFLEQIFVEFPEDIKSFLASPELAKNIGTLGDKFTFSTEQKTKLGNNIVKFFAGVFNSFSDFTDKLKEELGILENDLDNLTNDLSAQIFTPHKDYFEDLFEYLASPASQENVEDVEVTLAVKGDLASQWFIGEEEKERVEEQLKTLPEDLRSELSIGNAQNLVTNILSARNLSEEQINIAIKLTGKVMMGFLAPRDFINVLAQELQIGVDVARNIALEINEQVFLPVRDSLKKVHGLDKSKEAPSSVEMPVQEEELEVPKPLEG